MRNIRTGKELPVLEMKSAVQGRCCYCFHCTIRYLFRLQNHILDGEVDNEEVVTTTMDTDHTQHFDVMDVEGEENSIPDINIPEKSQSESCKSSSSNIINNSRTSHGTVIAQDQHNILADNPSQTLKDVPSNRLHIDNLSKTVIDKKRPPSAQSSAVSYVSKRVKTDTTIPSENILNQFPGETLPSIIVSSDSPCTTTTSVTLSSDDVHVAQTQSSTIVEAVSTLAKRQKETIEVNINDKEEIVPGSKGESLQVGPTAESSVDSARS